MKRITVPPLLLELRDLPMTFLPMPLGRCVCFLTL